MPRRTIESVSRIHITLPMSQTVLLEEITYDPRTRKPKYGARAVLIQTLIERFIAAYSAGESTIHVSDLFRQV